MSSRAARRARSRALRDAIHARDVSTAAALIASGVEVDPRDTEHGETGLLLAAQVGSVELVRLLLDQGADVHARDFVYERTALGFARWSHSLAVMQLLLEAGADLDARDGDGLTPLMLAVESEDEPVVGWLLANGADASLVAHGETALDLARAQQHHALVERLRRATGR